MDNEHDLHETNDERMPHETALIGVLFELATLQPDALAEVLQVVHPSDLQNRRNRQILTTMMELDIEGKPYGLVEVCDKIGTSGEIAKEALDLYNFAREHAMTFRVMEYAHKIREASERRRLAKVAEQIKQLSFSGDYGTSRELWDRAEELLATVEPLEIDKSGPVPVTSLLDKYLDGLTERYQSAKNGKVAMGIPTGLTDLDILWTGLKPRKYYVIAARPAIGKTQFIIDIALNITNDQNTYVLMFSAEMAKDEEMVNRMVSNRGRIEQGKLQTGMLQDTDWQSVTNAVSQISPRFYIDDTPNMSITHIKREARKFRRQIGPDANLVVMIDYLQLIDGPKNIRDDEYRLTSYVSKQLNSMKKEVNAAIIALSQLSRAVEDRPDKRPLMTDLRGSGQIEQDADLIAFLYRDDYYNPETERKNILEVITRKQRAGKTGLVELVFLRQFGAFLSLERTPGA